MQKSMITRLEPLLFLLIGVIFFCVGGKDGQRVFMIWGIVSLVFAAAVFLIHTFSKRKTENAFVPLFLLFVGCLVMCGGLFALRDKLLILVGGVFMIIGVLSGFLLSSEERRREDERFRKGIRLPDEYIILFAAMENRENEDLKWYVINKETGTPYVFCKGKYNLTDFGTIKTLACSKYARCLMMNEMKKRSFWADFDESNWWRKLRVKFDAPKTEISGEVSGKMKTGFFTCFACKKLIRAESSAYVNEKVCCRSCFYVELKGMKATVNKREKSIESLCSIDGIKKFSMHGSIMQAADKLLEGGFVFVSAQTGGGIDEISHTGAKAYNAVYTDYAMFRNMESDHKKREEEERKVSDGWIATLDYSYIIAEFKHNEMNVRMAAEGKSIRFAWSNMTEKETASARVFVEMIREILTDEKTEDERTGKKSAEEIQDILWVRNESGISPGDVIVIKSNLGFGWGHEETRYGIEVKEDGYHIRCTTSAPMAGYSDESHDLPVGFFFRTTNENIKKYFAGYSSYIDVKPEDIKDEDIARLKKYDDYCLQRKLMRLL